MGALEESEVGLCVGVTVGFAEGLRVGDLDFTGAVSVYVAKLLTAHMLDP